jgi:hypothetical protein
MASRCMALVGRFSLLSSIVSNKRCLCYRMLIQEESDHRRWSIRIKFQLFHIECIHGEYVTMRLVSLWRTWSSKAWLTEIRNALNAAFWRKIPFQIPGIRFQSVVSSGYIENDPMPPTAPCRGIRVIYSNRKAFCVLGCINPF